MYTVTVIEAGQQVSLVDSEAVRLLLSSRLPGWTAELSEITDRRFLGLERAFVWRLSAPMHEVVTVSPVVRDVSVVTALRRGASDRVTNALMVALDEVITEAVTTLDARGWRLFDGLMRSPAEIARIDEARAMRRRRQELQDISRWKAAWKSPKATPAPAESREDRYVRHLLNFAKGTEI